jgi:hypothetical protein
LHDIIGAQAAAAQVFAVKVFARLFNPEFLGCQIDMQDFACVAFHHFPPSTWISQHWLD